jgi:hypothetical protein
MALMLNSRTSARRYSAEALCRPPDKQFERTVIRRHGRAAARLRRYAA